MNYIINGLHHLMYGVILGTALYMAILVFLYILKKREGIVWQCVPEWIFCVYAVTLLMTTGIFTMNYHWSGNFSFHLLPFIGSAMIPVFLNFVLFIPYGFLLPLVFRPYKWNWRKIVAVGGLTSLLIEISQMFGGRYAEIDDLFLNTFGTFFGYILFLCMGEFKGNRKKAATRFFLLCAASVIAFAGIYMVSDRSESMPDGLSAVENSISEIRVYCGGEKRKVQPDSEIYHDFAVQLANCGGHVLKPQRISGDEIPNDQDCMIEIVYTSAQTVKFENAADFSISNADRILYNASENILYWGNSDYQYRLDFAVFDAQLEEHRSEILAQYQKLQNAIMEYFK